MTYCNRAWFDISGHRVVEDYKDICWQDALTDEGNATSAVQFDLMVNHKQATTFQFQVQRTWSNEQGGEGEAWCLTSAYPEIDEDGTVIGVAGSLTDISELKWAESVQRQRIEEAIEAKRQQDNFIDVRDGIHCM